MSYGSLISKILFSFILSSSVLYRYGNWFHHRIFVTFIVLLAWNFSFLIIFALPLDVVFTVYRQCIAEHINATSHIDNASIFVNDTCPPPWSNVHESVFPNLWRTVYWSTQCLTWLLMPMMQSYIKAGDFTIKGKLKSALIDNAIYYGSYLLICCVLLVYLSMKLGISYLDWPKIKAIASSASNTWGLFLLVLLLGYSLVEVPRNLWNNSNTSYVLTHLYFKMAKLASSKCEAEETVDNVLESLHDVSQLIKPGHFLYGQLETILQKIPTELTDRMNRRNYTSESLNDIPTEKVLIRLHRQTIKSLQVFQRTETQYNILMQRIFEVEDTLKNQISRDRQFKRTFQRPTTWFTRYIYTSTIEWYWKCIFYGYLQKILAIFGAIFSVLVIWSEVTFFNKQPVLSVFARIVDKTKSNNSYFAIEVLSTTIILYLCYCAYSTVLKIRLLNLYYLAPHHQTNEYSLIFSGMMLSRLTPPLCLNFLGLIHMDSHIIKEQIMETDYTQVMGHMDVIGIISDGFNVYFPMAILLFCLATYFSLGSRILNYMGFQQFIGEDDMTTDLIEEGRDFVKREKRKRQRAEESLIRRQDFQERFPANRIRSSSSVDRRTPMESMGTQRSNLLSSRQLDSYNGTQFQQENIDSEYSPEDIDARFGASTGFNSNNQDHRFSEGYQMGSYSRRVGIDPRGIFDDV